MELKHDFTVAVPVEQAWRALLDLERIAPCMPGATLTSYEGDEFTGTVRVKLGPVVMTFAGKGAFVERDESSRRMVIEAAGKERKGGGSARATIRATLHDQGGSTDVAVHTDLVITGRAAQFGRGMIADVSTRLLGQFTDCLAGKLGEPESPAQPSPGVDTDAGVPSSQARTATPGEATVEPELPAGQPPGQRRETGTGPMVEAEPIDLLGVTGIRAAAVRVMPYVLIFVLGALIGAALVLWLG
jgi:uncharacterized protein